MGANRFSRVDIDAGPGLTGNINRDDGGAGRPAGVFDRQVCAKGVDESAVAAAADEGAAAGRKEMAHLGRRRLLEDLRRAAIVDQEGILRSRRIAGDIAQDETQRVRRTDIGIAQAGEAARGGGAKEYIVLPDARASIGSCHADRHGAAAQGKSMFDDHTCGP